MAQNREACRTCIELDNCLWGEAVLQEEKAKAEADWAKAAWAAVEI